MTGAAAPYGRWCRRQGRRATGVALVGLAAALAAGEARAYVQSTTMDGWPTAWRDHTIRLEFYGKDPPQYLEHDTMMNMVLAAAGAWSTPAVACTDLSLQVVEVDESFAPANYDQVNRNLNANRIGFRKDEWRKMPCDIKTEMCDPYGSNAIAITTVTSNKRTGQILDADIELNGVTQKFADVVIDGPRPRASAASAQDLQNTLTHELGHLIGLDHNCYDPAANATPPRDQNGMTAALCSTANATIAEATMFNSALPGEVKKRDLADDDLAAICAIYKPIDDSGGCAMVPHRPPARQSGTMLLVAGLFAAVFSGLLAGIIARRRRR